MNDYNVVEQRNNKSPTHFEKEPKFDYVDLIFPKKELIVDYVDKAEFFNKQVSEYILLIVSKL